MSPQRTSVTSEAAEAVLHYKRKLSRHLDDDSPEIVLHCLDKLEQIPVNISILQDTGIGKVVNHLKKSDNADESVIEKARIIVQKWKEIVANEEQEMNLRAAASADEDEDHSTEEDEGHQNEDSGSNQSEDEDVEEEEVESDPPILEPELEERPASKSKPQSSKSEESKKSKREEENSTSSSRSKSSSKERDKSKDSSRKHKHSKEESHSSSSSSKKKKKDKDREKEREKEKEKEKEREREKEKEREKEREREKAKEKERQKEREREKEKEKEKKKKREKEESRKRKHESNSEEESEKTKKKKQESDRNKQHSDGNGHNDDKSSKKSSSSKKIQDANGFSAALLDTEKPFASSRSKKESGSKTGSGKPDEKPVSSVPVDLNPNYQPTNSKVAMVPQPAKPYSNLTDGKTDDEALSALISMSKNAKRTAVYSGSKRSAFGAGKVPRLSELCIMKLHEHVDSIVDCRGLGFDVLEPILERAKPETLMVIEDYNSYLTEHTGNLWERICKRQFPKENRQEFEAWREMYERCTAARQKKLDFLSEKLNKSYKNAKDNHRKTKLAYVDGVAKAPRNVQRAQEKNGTGFASSSSSLNSSMASTSSSSAFQPKKYPGPSSGSSKPSTQGGPSGSVSVPAPPAAAAKKPKVAPMMAKTLKMVRGLKVNFRR